MEYKIEGTTMQVAKIMLKANQKVFAEAGALAWMTDTIEIDTKARGGVMAGLGRMLAGESFFMTEFTTKTEGEVTFGSEVPGKIIPISLNEGQAMICQRDSFLCADDSVEVKMKFKKKLGAGLFGGEGFILQEIKGPGTFLANVGGEVVEYNLKPGEKMKIDTGSIAMFEPTCNYDIQRAGNLKTMFLGGEGLFLATLTGPGKIWLQTMPIYSLAQKIISFLPAKG